MRGGNTCCVTDVIVHIGEEITVRPLGCDETNDYPGDRRDSEPLLLTVLRAKSQMEQNLGGKCV